MLDKVRQTHPSTTFPTHQYVMAARGSVWQQLRTPKKTDFTDYLVQNKNGRNVARLQRQIPHKKKVETEKEKKKPIKTHVLGPWRPMSCLKCPGRKVKGHRLGSEVISHCLEFNYYCLSRYVPLHLNGLTRLMYLGGKTREQISTSILAYTFVCTCTGKDSGIPIIYGSGWRWA